MDEKRQRVTQLEQEFKRWQKLIAGLTEEQINSPVVAGELAIKDQLAHLWAWQQRSIARLEAAQSNTLPQLPTWSDELDLNSEEDTDKNNEVIYTINRERPWTSIYQDWREGFLRFLELARAIPDQDLFDTAKYPWLEGYSLADVLEGSYEHHHVDHLEPLLAQFGKNA